MAPIRGVEILAHWSFARLAGDVARLPQVDGADAYGRVVVASIVQPHEMTDRGRRKARCSLSSREGSAGRFR